MKKTVLLLGNYLPSLVVARVLAADGYRVIGGDGGEFSTLRYSRACDQIWPHPPVHREPEFLDALEGFLDSHPEVGLVVPLQERYVGLLARQRARFSDRVTIASPSPQTVLTAWTRKVSTTWQSRQRCHSVAPSHALTWIRCAPLLTQLATRVWSGRPEGRSVRCGTSARPS
jgi:hypothetical protein